MARPSVPELNFVETGSVCSDLDSGIGSCSPTSTGPACVPEHKSVQTFRSTEDYLYAMKEDLAEWLNSLYDQEIDTENFFDKLENGVLLCDHANHVQMLAEEYRDDSKETIPERGPLYKRNVKNQTFQARDNIANFIQWCKRLGIPDVILFETEDLVMRKNEKSVILALLEVARRGAKFGMLVPCLIQLEQEIDAEIKGSSEPVVQRITCDMKSLDEMVRELVSQCTCLPLQFPVVRLAEGKYQVGENKTLIFVRILRNHVMVRVGGGWDTLANYLYKHDPCRCKRRSSVARERRVSQTMSKFSSPSTASRSRKVSGDTRVTPDVRASSEARSLSEIRASPDIRASTDSLTVDDQKSTEQSSSSTAVGSTADVSKSSLPEKRQSTGVPTVSARRRLSMDSGESRTTERSTERSQSRERSGLPQRASTVRKVESSPMVRRSSDTPTNRATPDMTSNRRASDATSSVRKTPEVSTPNRRSSETANSGRNTPSMTRRASDAVSSGRKTPDPTTPGKTKNTETTVPVRGTTGTERTRPSRSTAGTPQMSNGRTTPTNSSDRTRTGRDRSQGRDSHDGYKTQSAKTPERRSRSLAGSLSDIRQQSELLQQQIYEDFSDDSSVASISSGTHSVASSGTRSTASNGAIKRQGVTPMSKSLDSSKLREISRTPSRDRNIVRRAQTPQAPQKREELVRRSMTPQPRTRSTPTTPTPRRREPKAKTPSTMTSTLKERLNKYKQETQMTRRASESHESRDSTLSGSRYKSPSLSALDGKELNLDEIVDIGGDEKQFEEMERMFEKFREQEKAKAEKEDAVASIHAELDRRLGHQSRQTTSQPRQTAQRRSASATPSWREKSDQIIRRAKTPDPDEELIQMCRCCSKLTEILDKTTVQAKPRKDKDSSRLKTRIPGPSTPSAALRGRREFSRSSSLISLDSSTDSSECSELSKSIDVGELKDSRCVMSRSMSLPNDANRMMAPLVTNRSTIIKDIPRAMSPVKALKDPPRSASPVKAFNLSRLQDNAHDNLV